MSCGAHTEPHPHSSSPRMVAASPAVSGSMEMVSGEKRPFHIAHEADARRDHCRTLRAKALVDRSHFCPTPCDSTVTPAPGSSLRQGEEDYTEHVGGK